VASFSPAGGRDVNCIGTDRWLVAEEREEGLFVLDCMTAIDPIRSRRTLRRHGTAWIRSALWKGTRAGALKQAAL